MSVSSRERSLASRIAHLDQMVGRRGAGGSKTVLSTAGSTERLVRRLAGREALLDALMALYDECSGEPLKQHSLAAQFVDKYRVVIGELRRQRVSAADFQVLCTIGRGHFGHVQTVRQRDTELVFAMKVLRKPQPITDNQAMFFDEERDIMAETTSPWLTSLHFAFQDATNLYLVMDYHAGGDLMGLLERQDGDCLSEPTARFYLAEIVLALKDLHAMGYVHRDLKPDNVLLDRCGHVRLADFGSAARLCARSGNVTAAMPVGTPDYQAPEILQAINATGGGSGGGGAPHTGGATAVDHHSTAAPLPLDATISYGKECDYWALGVVAYELLTGVTPFRGDQSATLEQTYQNIINFKRCLTRPECPALSDAAWSLISGLLTDSRRRLQHSQLLQHEFFISTSWTGIASSPPPYIPKVVSADDTSHFDTVADQHNHQQSQPCIDSFISRARANTFTGRHLPYIGFSYCRQRGATDDQRAASDTGSARTRVSVMSLSGDREGASLEQLERKVGEQRGHLLQLQQKLSGYESGDLDKQLKQLTEKLNEKNELVASLLSERDQLEQSVARCTKRAMAAERLLDMEKKDRVSTEKRALELIQDVKRKWKREEDERIKSVQEEVKRCQQQYRELEQQYTNTLSQLRQSREQLQRAEEACKDSEARAKLSAGKHNDCSRLDFDQLQSRLQQATLCCEQQAAELNKRTAAHRQLTDELQHQLQQLVADNTSLKHQVGELGDVSLHVQRLETEAARLTRDTVRLTGERDQLRRQLVESDRLMDQLHSVNSQLSEQLQNVKSQLESANASTAASAADLTRTEQLHSDAIKQLQTQLDSCLLERDQLQSQLSALTQKEESHQKRISQLESLLESMQSSLTELEQHKDSLVERESFGQQCAISSEELESVQREADVLRATVQRLESQLESSRDRAAVDRHKLHEMELQMAKNEKQLCDWKIDVRIANREARTAEQQLERLRAGDSQWQLERQQLQLAEAELRRQLAECQSQTEQARRLAERCGDEKSALCTAHQDELKRLEQKLAATEDKLLAAAGVRVQLESVERERERLERQLVEERQRVQQKVEQLAVADESQHRLTDQLNDRQTQLNDKDNTIKSLKELCSVLDSQLTDMDQLISDKNKTIESLRQQKAEVEQSVERVQGEVRAARTACNEHRSLRALQERRADQLQQRLDELETDGQSRTDTLSHQLHEYQQLSRSLTEQLSVHDSQLTETRHQLVQAERQRDQLLAECTGVKEERSQLLTQVAALKQSTFQLSEALETAVDRAESFKHRVGELEERVEEMQTCHLQDEKRYEDTISQQSKLIDFLQAKTEALPKKKTLAGRIFGGDSAGGGGGGGGGGKSSKENVNPVPLRYRELERLLQQERLNCKQLCDQLTCARAEIVALSNKADADMITPCIGTTPRSRQALQVLVQSPGVQQTPQRPRISSASASHLRSTPATASSTIVSCSSSSASNIVASVSTHDTAIPHASMHHNIPHRFETALMTRAAKCVACLRPVRFGRQVARCHECNIVVHPKCASELPRTCGLPAALARHFSSSWQESSTLRSAVSAAAAAAGGGTGGADPATAVGPAKPPRTLLSSFTPTSDNTGGHGWIRTPRTGKSGWEKSYLVVSDHHLRVYSDQPPWLSEQQQQQQKLSDTFEPLQSLDLTSGHVHVDPDVAHSEVVPLARRDLPFVFKVMVVPDSTCWPLQTLHFLCSNLIDKQLWVQLLETACSSAAGGDTTSAAAAAAAAAAASLVSSSVLFTADEQQSSLDINCAHLIDDGLLLVGAEDGLYSVCLDERRPETVVRVAGFPAVFMIKAVYTVDQLILITGENHSVCMAELVAARACAEAGSTSAARLDTVGLDGIEHCHLVTAAPTNNGNVFVCAASADRIAVFCWNQQLVCYQLLKQFSTQEPATCLHITPRSSAIIGTGRFFEVDLINFCIEEFLDSSDASLSYIVYGTTQLRSFPVAILALNERNDEYLLCYHELGVFVDEFGARSRPHDIKWTRLPLAFAYHAPFVYIFHFNAVEVLELSGESFTDRCSATSGAPPVTSRQLQLPAPRLLTPSADGSAVLLATSRPVAAGAGAAGGGGGAECGARAQICRISVEPTHIDNVGVDTVATAKAAETGITAVGADSTAESEPANGETEAASLNFSFTPSLEEALDTGSDATSMTSSDLASLDPCDDAGLKRVHFKESVLVRQHVPSSGAEYRGDIKRRKS